ncbi:MAG TPA: hypothetical protein PK992_02120 [Planctomycetaceae bacterium]|nr:hypothetical protein [Planctomycetaceae bacterium]
MIQIGRKLLWRLRRFYSHTNLSWSRLRKLKSSNPPFGFGCGQCIDRYFIEQFLEAKAADIRGNVLEIGDAEYTTRFGAGNVAQSSVLHAVAGNTSATIVGDLASGMGIPSERFDCFIMTQTRPCVFDLVSAMSTVWRCVKPGGIVLATLPGICSVSRYDADRWGDFWRFTPQSVARLFGDAFGPQNIEVQSFGNVASATAILHGLVIHEMRPEELAFKDEDYPVVICCRAVKCG